MPSGVPTLGEHLAYAGYRGIGVSANPNICEELGFARGFESFTLKNDVGAEDLIERFHQARSEEEIGRPLFAYFHLNDPHAPYQKHEEHCPHLKDGSECTFNCWYQSEIDFVGAQLDSLFDEMGWWEDAVIVFVNDPEYGGCAGTVSNVAAAHSSRNVVATHELGHSIFGLADEYQYNDNSTYTGSEPNRPNVSTYNSTTMAGNMQKWHYWLSIEGVSTFEGAYYNDFGIYRPISNCRMSRGRPAAP